jgi:K+-sensing histidine kinase KdpD
MDNKESIESIHGLIESENTLKDKNRDINIGLFVFIITMMEGLKVTIEIIEDKESEHNIYKLIFGILVVFIILLVKWNSIITSILNIIDFDFLTKTSTKKDNKKK